MASAPLLLLLFCHLPHLLPGAASGAGDGKCADGSNSGEGTCAAASGTVSKAKEFWKEMKKQGLEMKIKGKSVGQKAVGGVPAHNRTAMVLSDDVFYGRAIMKIPRRALLSLETTSFGNLRDELNRFLFEEQKLKTAFNVTGENDFEDYTHLLSVAYPLIAESRNPDSVYREWLEAARSERLFALELTQRQLRVLVGTTIEGADEEMVKRRDLIQHTATNLTFFRDRPVTKDEAAWAMAVIMRHARLVHPHQDDRNSRDPRMHLFPFVDMLSVAMHPDPGVAITFQEEIIIDGKKEEDVVLQIARRDMPKGEEIFVWPGRLSNSEMVARHGFSFEKNPVGIGRNITQPPSWNNNPEEKARKEYALYNCSTLDQFEMRFSERGYPMRNFVRCYRVSWFITNGWYSPSLKNRLRDLNKWPPPAKYTKDDWLSWTQADAEINRHILSYCQQMRQQLKETMDSAIAEDFRNSKDPVDRVLWAMRGEETRTFKNCIAVAKTIQT
eukprot:TRINITY_DN29160_c0_g1_i1.p1 TRINITY_DN29160_c0_g1~~TRINITY_DN29160_c0_g1_i1.p1  ORF type:complete len:510 (+),score=100.55 TRINITY_DN29160_c0_g1_i1:35-1531(+)